MNIKMVLTQTLPEADGLWCVVANIKCEHPWGPDSKETRVGTRQFRGGAKVYIVRCFSGSCDGLVAIGRHRKSKRFITSVVHVKHAENFRAKVVYHPQVLAAIRSDKKCRIMSREDAESWAMEFPQWQNIWEKKATE